MRCRTFDADHVQTVLDGLAHALLESRNLVILDRSGTYRAKRLRISAHRHLIMPPYAPALNHMERFWRALTDSLARRLVPDLTAPARSSDG